MTIGCRPSFLLTIALAVAATGAAARADRIVLRGGGTIRGVILPDKGRPGYVLVQTENSPTPLEFKQEQIERVTAESGPLKEYLGRRAAVEPTAQAHHDLARWCESNKLTGPATIHDRKAVEIDPAFAPSHRQLGHVEFEGRWLSHSDLREAQGMVRHDGRWISYEEKQKAEERGEETARETTWGRQIAVLRKGLASTAPAERARARDQILAIREPEAVPALARLLGRDGPAYRSLLAEALGSIPGEAARAAMVDRLLAEPDSNVRAGFVTELARRNEPEATRDLVRALRHRNPTIVGRAAWALSGLNATEAVPSLIPVLVVVQRRMTWVPGAGGSGPGGAPITAGGISPGPGVGPYVPVLTPPAVAPGAVAFGGTSVPIDQYAYAVGAARPPAAPPRLGMVNDVYRNIEVLDALQKLTGQDFGYDRAAWANWARASFRPAPEAARRVPQP